MRKTLLIAASALAASVISSQAGVYSQNIVGYVNYPTPVGFNTYILAVPFNIGASNGANEVFGTSLQGANDFTQLYTWNANKSAFTGYLSDDGSPSGWDDINYTPTNAPILAVGQGFLLIPSAGGITNTFAGAVAVQVGTQNTNTYATAFDTYYVGSAIPYAGVVTNGGNTGGGLNLSEASLGAAQDFSQFYFWNPAKSSYTGYLTDGGSPSGWDDINYTPTNPPSINVGDAFLVIPASANLQWVQGL